MPLPSALKKYKFLLPGIWLLSAFGTSIVTIILLLVTITHVEQPDIKYYLFSAKPHVLGSAETRVESKGAQAAQLNAVFEAYGCPLAGHGDKFVVEAEKNNIPYWLVPAISFQESSCGKVVPHVDDVHSNNMYGWGVWGENVKQFQTVDEGIETVSKYMSTRFYSQGITDLCEIMKVYTPSSNGSWCAGVSYFRDVITHYQSR